MSKYISLHNHTMYSMMNSIVKPAELFKRAAELEMNSVAVTDNYTFAGIWSSYKAAKANKVKLIVGCQYNFTDDLQPFVDFKDGKSKEKPKFPIKTLILLAKNGAGYRNVLLLNRKSFDYRFGKIPLIDWNLLQNHSEGVICLTGDSTGIIGNSVLNNDYNKAKQDVEKLKGIFNDDLIVELEPNNLRHGLGDQVLTNRAAYKLATELDIMPVATSNARYLLKEQQKYHDLVMAIKSGRSLSDTSRPRFELDQLYLHNDEQIVKFFTRNFGAEFANKLCENTLIVADRFEAPDWVKPEVVTGDKKQLPTFPCKDDEQYSEFLQWKEQQPDILEEDKLFMRFKCAQTWDKLIPKEQESIYKDRLQTESYVYEKLGFASYMLISHDFINWARKNNIPVGPGRGSCGGSLVGNLLGIHQADPIKYGLIFERFLNLEKLEYP